MEKEYSINFITDGEYFDPKTIQKTYGWFMSRGIKKENAIRNLVEKVRAKHPACNVLFLGDFVQTKKYWHAIGYAVKAGSE